MLADYGRAVCGGRPYHCRHCHRHSFANPAVTIARAASNTFAGIRPDDVAAFVVAQLLGAAAATLLFRWLLPPEETHEFP
jgi:glycerol uptake facilitator-like aquaporin